MTEPLRILHLISRLDGYGGARLLRELAPRQSRAGGRVGVTALAAEPFVVHELRAAGVAVQELHARWPFDPIAAGRLARLRRRARAAFVHAWDGAALAYGRLTWAGEPLVAAWIDAGATPAWQQRLAPRGVAALRPGAAPRCPTARYSRGEACAALGVPADARWIAVVGPLVRRRQLDESIWCYELVRVLHPDVRLVLLGDGPDSARLQRYARLVSEPGCVLFPGYRADVNALLEHADAYWQLDAPRTTPFALLEAMAAGAPVVASNVPALAAAVEHGATGLLAPLNHRAAAARATDQLLSDKALRRRLAEAAATRIAARWSLEASCRACELLYSV